MWQKISKTKLLIANLDFVVIPTLLCFINLLGMVIFGRIWILPKKKKRINLWILDFFCEFSDCRLRNLAIFL